VAEVARRLDAAYGPRLWRRHGSPLDELIETVLSQNTSDINTERAFRSLRERFSSWEAVRTAPVEEIADAIRSGGLANVKAPRIQAILESIVRERGSLELDGVGPKTAACVLLFALGKPALPVDTHVHRVALRLGLIPPGTSAEAAHELLEALLGEDHDRVYAFHVEAIAHGRQVCTARRPFCERCPLTDCCDFYNATIAPRRDDAPPRSAPGRG
jgi:endonuclease-3